MECFKALFANCVVHVADDGGGVVCSVERVEADVAFAQVDGTAREHYFSFLNL
jgi:hypothetical protein